jgi:hypothetical protein
MTGSVAVITMQAHSSLLDRELTEALIAHGK